MEYMHYGVLGMKLGIRRGNRKSGKSNSGSKVRKKLADASYTRRENKELRKKAKKQSYVRNIGRTVGGEI